MADFFDYLSWRGDLPFDAVPPNPVDTLILSELSYIGFDGLVPGDFLHPVPLKVAAEAFLALPDWENRVRIKKDADLIAECARTRRFGQLRLIFYRNELLPEQESQFAAVTWLLPSGAALVTFRGTDLTLTGWKEDFNMSFQTSVPAQEKALRYVEAFARVHPTMPIYLAGHSKGGNMAVYAAARCQPELQSRIEAVHNHDGPGFQRAILAEPGYRSVLPKVRTFVPQSSVVGMLLEHEEPYTVVKSRQLSLLQHEPFSWEVLGGDFIHLEEIDENSRFLDRTIKAWLADTSLQERNDFVDAVFELLTLGQIDDLREVILPRNVLRYLRTLSTDEQMRSVIAREFADLFRTAVELRRKKEPLGLPEQKG
ncbi:MAG: DUF2974 domain-containing protein [Ruminococcaceae bacterium]|nr:DUF2974 domain-containing protein [Oscillospiraceae bacterium]